MSARQPLDLGQCLVDPLGVETAPAAEKGILVAEVAMLRTTARDDDRIGHEIALALDQVAADRRQALDRAAAGRDVARLRAPRAEVIEEARECLLAGADEDGVGVARRFLGHGGDVQPAECDEAALGAIVIGQRIGAIGVGDIDLDDDEIGRVVGAQQLDMIVDQLRLIVG